ncbi:hypothetical protein [Kibdelosporangium persicum]|uniref:hypothetical protein n=1 Tax=Kibdelosporangium persicum TaxID=2698649 RepID=UPI001563549C|nr:hypothetical protein [Kibdelosporangium persicum]
MVAATSFTLSSSGTTEKELSFQFEQVSPGSDNAIIQFRIIAQSPNNLHLGVKFNGTTIYGYGPTSVSASRADYAIAPTVFADPPPQNKLKFTILSGTGSVIIDDVIAWQHFYV